MGRGLVEKLHLRPYTSVLKRRILVDPLDEDSSVSSLGGDIFRLFTAIMLTLGQVSVSEVM